MVKSFPPRGITSKEKTEKVARPKNSSEARSKINYYLDIVLTLGFIVGLNPQLTGYSLHEYIGLVFAAALAVHLSLHWQWVVAISKRIRGNLPRKTRINYLLNLTLFLDFITVTLTGLIVSELLSIAMPRPLFHVIEEVHSFTSYAAIVLVALHLLLHWSWIVKMTQKLLRRPIKAKEA